MPRLAGVNIVGVLLAALAIYVIGFVWYGFVFDETYMNGMGIYYNEARDAFLWLNADGMQTTTAGGSFDPWMAAGLVIPLVLAYGLGWHMKQKGITKLTTAVLYGLWLSLLIGVPLTAYGLVYSPWHSVPAFLVGASHTVLTFVAGCAVLSFFD